MSGNRSGNSIGSFDELFNGDGNVKSTKVLYGDGCVNVMSPLVRDGHRDGSLDRHSHVIFNECFMSPFVWEYLLMFAEALDRDGDPLFKDIRA
jgi:hypothetical protein